MDEKIIAENKRLVEEYPFLIPRNYFTDEILDDYDYSFTELDDMPEGWRIAFSEQMCDEIQKELERVNFVDEYRIVQVKEKFGGLRWYTGGVPINSKLDDIARKYEYLSEETCIECGRPATYRTLGWICPYCDLHVPLGEKTVLIKKEEKNV